MAHWLLGQARHVHRRIPTAPSWPILAGLVDEVSDELSRVWPLLRILDRVGGRSDEAIVNFSMERARLRLGGTRCGLRR